MVVQVDGEVPRGAAGGGLGGGDIGSTVGLTGGGPTRRRASRGERGAIRGRLGMPAHAERPRPVAGVPGLWSRSSLSRARLRAATPGAQPQSRCFRTTTPIHPGCLTETRPPRNTSGSGATRLSKSEARRQHRGKKGCGAATVPEFELWRFVWSVPTAAIARTDAAARE